MHFALIEPIFSYYPEYYHYHLKYNMWLWILCNDWKNAVLSMSDRDWIFAKGSRRNT